MKRKIRIVLADHDQSYMEDLKIALHTHPHFVVVGLAVDGSGAVDRCLETFPDVLVVNIALPVLDGVKVVQTLTTGQNNLQVLVLSDFDADAAVLQAIKEGAKGFVRKQDPVEEISRAIEQIGGGDVFLPSTLAHLMLNEFDRLSANFTGQK